MQIRAGYQIAYECAQPTPMLLMLSVHPSRLPDLITPHRITFSPPVEATEYRDTFGNICTRVVAPPGGSLCRPTSSSTIPARRTPSPRTPRRSPSRSCPTTCSSICLGSRYCDTDHLANMAWSLFGNGPPGWARVQAICDYVHQRLRFGYQHASPTRTAWDGFASSAACAAISPTLPITLCRCMNIPARYCTGYLGDIGVPGGAEPMDFSAWFEAYLGGRWYTFDARHNTPRIGRILMARGRDATDVALSTSFGATRLARFNVHTDEVVAAA